MIGPAPQAQQAPSAPLLGQVALVTGAGGMKGIGRAIAVKLASLGADIVLSDLKRPATDLPPGEVRAQWRSIDSVGEEVEALGRRAHRRWCDLGDGAQVRAMVEDAATCFGRLDILVNNARAVIGRDVAPVHELDEDVWRLFLNVNTTAAFIATKYAGQAMIRQGGGGRIINIASSAGKTGMKAQAAYCSSKFAMIGLTQSSALDLAPHGITVNAVCPGSTDTDRMNYAERDLAAKEGMPLEAFRARKVAGIAKGIPMGRMGTSEDIANLAAFLAGAEASFITGQAYNVNGGQIFH